MESFNPFYHFRHFHRASDGAEVATKSDHLQRYEPHADNGTLLYFEHGGQATVWHVSEAFDEVKRWATGEERLARIFEGRSDLEPAPANAGEES